MLIEAGLNHGIFDNVALSVARFQQIFCFDD